MWQCLTLLGRSLSTCVGLSPVQSCTHRRPPTDNEKTMPRCRVQIPSYKNNVGLEKNSRTTIFAQPFPWCISNFYIAIIKIPWPKSTLERKSLSAQGPESTVAQRSMGRGQETGSWRVTFSSACFLQWGCSSQTFCNLLKQRHQLGTERSNI